MKNLSKARFKKHNSHRATRGILAQIREAFFDCGRLVLCKFHALCWLHLSAAVLLQFVGLYFVRRESSKRLFRAWAISCSAGQSVWILLCMSPKHS
jgi:hypothetical protein